MENMQIQINLIDGAFKAGIEKFIFLGSFCIYPKSAPQALKEVVGFEGELYFNYDKPNFTRRKLTDSSKLINRIERLYNWFIR